MTRVDTAVIVDLLQRGMASGQRPALTITSNSMAPLLRSDDQIQIEAVAPAALRPGDIVVMAGESLVTHRYWGQLTVDERAHLLTRGDRPLAFDPPWPAQQLVGRAVGRRRNGRSLPLITGAGARLNRHLAWLARFEMRLLAGRQSAVVGQRPELARAGWLDHTSYPGGRRLPPRLARRAIYSWAWLVTQIVQLINR